MKSLSLQWRIMLLTTAAVGLVSLLGLTLVIRDSVQAGERDFREAAHSIAAAMMPMLENTLVIGDLATVQQTIDPIVIGQASVKRVALLSPKTRTVVVERIDDSLAAQLVQPPAWFAALAGSKETSEERDIVVGGVAYGTLRLEMSTRALMHDVWSSTKKLSLTGTVCLLIVVALIGIAVADGLRPLRLLHKHASHLAAGEWKDPIPPVSVPEVAAVADAFNHMAACIVQRENEILRARDAAEAGARAKAAFLATMSHEIRTPMNGIIGLTDLTLTTDLTEEQRGYLELVKSSADSLLVVLNDILDFSKIDAGKLDIERVPTDVRALAEQVSALFHSRANDKQLGFDIYIAPTLPPALQADPVRLRQVLTNLLSNAIKFTTKGSVRLAVYADQLSDSVARVSFAVTDTGIGIPAEKQATILEPFTQADSSTTRNYGGTGLGLAICNRLIGLMGGHLILDSTEGVGSTFRFSLDLTIADAAAPAAPQQKAAPQMAAGRRILVAEDVPTNQKLIELVLAKHGYKPTLVVNGQEAVDAFDVGSFDLVLMDMQMPKLDGIAATARIRELEAGTGRRTPIVALTANAFEADKQRCLQVGMDGFLSKPFRTDELLAVLEQHLGNSTKVMPPNSVGNASSIS